MISEAIYYARAFCTLRSEGYVYCGGGVYEKRGVRVRVRSYDEWSENPGKYYTNEVET